MITRRRRQELGRRWGNYAGQLVRQSRQVAVKGGALVVGAAARFAKERAWKAVKKAITKKKPSPFLSVHPVGGHHWRAKWAEFNKMSKGNAIASRQNAKRFDTVTVQGGLTGTTGVQAINDGRFSVLTPWDISTLTAYTASSIRQPFIKWVKVRLLITNITNANTFVTLYVVRGKGDHQERTEFPQAAWTSGLLATAGSFAYQLPGNEPSTSVDFRQQWKVLKKLKLTMSAGESFTFDYYYACNHKLNQRRITDAITGPPDTNAHIIASGTGAYGPLTRYFMVAAHGAAYGNVETPSDVSTSAASLAMLMTATYCSQNFNVSNEDFNYSNTLPGSDRLIQETDGDILAQTSAL